MLAIFMFLISLTLTLIFCFEAPRRSFDRNETIPFKIKRIINSYRLFIQSSGKLRQSLLLLVFMSSWYLLTTPFQSDFLKNISYALIATFIFDTGLNFNKENIEKTRISQRWHSHIYSGYDRLKAINQLATPYQPHTTLESTSTFIVSALFLENEHTYAKKDDELMWSGFSDTFLNYKNLSIKKGQSLRGIAFLFISEDYDFAKKLRMDDAVFLSFPTIIKSNELFYNTTRNLLAYIEEPIRFHKNIETLKTDIMNYLEIRTSFFTEIESIMGHYGMR